MEINSSDESLLSLIRSGRSLALITDKTATANTISAMMAFYHLFKVAEKKIRVVVPEAVPIECQDLPESSVIAHDLGPKNLLVSLNTQGSQLEKISYFQEGSTFNLVIHPKERSFEVSNIHYSYEGDKYDAFILFSVLKLSDLEDLYLKNEKEFSKTPIVNIDYRTTNEKYGSINVVESQFQSLSMLLFRKIGYWSLNPNVAAATSILKGITTKDSSKAQPSVSTSAKPELANSVEL